MQTLREKNFKQTIPRVVVKEGEVMKSEIVTVALRRAATFFAALQSNQGHWPAENSGPLFFSPSLVLLFNPKFTLFLISKAELYYRPDIFLSFFFGKKVFALYITGHLSTIFSEEHRKEIFRYTYCHQVKKSAN